MAHAPSQGSFSLQRISVLDETAMQWVTHVRTSVRTSVMRFITATPVWLTVLLSVLAAVTDGSFIQGAIAGGVATGLASVLVQGIKFTVRRARPSMAYAIAQTLDRYSFPSGHSCSAFAVAGAALVVAPLMFPVMFIAATLIAFSRVYLGVHYPSDVLTGAIMGLLVGAVTFGMGLAGGFAGAVWALL